MVFAYDMAYKLILRAELTQSGHGLSPPPSGDVVKGHQDLNAGRPRELHNRGHENCTLADPRHPDDPLKNR
jgi:hypothetical protein